MLDPAPQLDECITKYIHILLLLLEQMKYQPESRFVTDARQLGKLPDRLFQ